jgi:ribosomal protein S18 acetylase RimI-like enzyme
MLSTIFEHVGLLLIESALNTSAMQLPNDAPRDLCGGSSAAASSTHTSQWNKANTIMQHEHQHSNTTISVRKAQHADLEQVLQIEQQCFSVPYGIECFIKCMGKPNHLILVAVHQAHASTTTTTTTTTSTTTSSGSSMIAGYCMLRLRNNIVELTSLAVSATMRGKGVANQLLATSIDAARASHALHMSLRVSIFNKVAIALYSKLGFVSIDYVVAYYNYHQGCAEDALEMHLKLVAQ